MFDSLYGGTQEKWATVMDWFDKDDTTRLDGGEQTHYLGLDSPYRSSGVRMSWPDELGLVKGFNNFRAPLEAMAVPSVKPVKINVNTASREMLSRILRFMQVSLDGEEWADMLEVRRYNPFHNLDDFYGRLVSYADERLTKSELAWASRFLDVKSAYFLAVIQIRLGNASFYLQSMLVRDTEDPYDVYVLQRRLGKVALKRRNCRVDNPIVVEEEKESERKGNVAS